MKLRRRNITVFSISALDLFAAALGAFILIVLVLFPYYKLGGTDVSFEELEEQVRKRRLVASSTQTEMSQIRAIQAEIRLLDKEFRTAKVNMSTIEDRIREVQKQTSEIQIPVPKPVPIIPPRSTNQGVEFSILGLATTRKEVVIVVDMSGSMRSHTSNVSRAINEILDVMQADNRFAILGYRGGPTYDSFPRGGQFVAATPSTVSQARTFVSGMSRRFGGGTPTLNAMVRALNMQPEAIILISDGAPDDGTPTEIVENLTNRNQEGQTEIHTVAIGDYTSDKNLTLFLQDLANRNRGDFVGRAR